MQLSHNSTSVNSMTDTAANSLSKEKPVKENKNKMEDRSTNQICARMVSGTGKSESGLDDSPSFQLSKGKMDNQALDCTSFTDSNSKSTSDRCEFPKDPSIAPCENLNMSKQPPEVSQCTSFQTMNVKHCKFEECNGSCTENSQTRSQCSIACNIHPVATSKKNKSKTLALQCGDVNKTSHYCRIQKGEQNLVQVGPRNFKQARVHQVGACERGDFRKFSISSRSNGRSKKQSGQLGETLFRLHNKFVFAKKDLSQIPHDMHSFPVSPAHIQQNVPCSTKIFLPVRSGNQEYCGMKMPLVNHVLHSSICSQTYVGCGIYDNYIFRKEAASGRIGKKWIPVGRKESTMLEKTEPAHICNDHNDMSRKAQVSKHLPQHDNLPSSFNGINNSHPKAQTNALCGLAASNIHKSSSLVSSNHLTSIQRDTPQNGSPCAAEVKNGKSTVTDTGAYGNHPKEMAQTNTLCGSLISGNHITSVQSDTQNNGSPYAAEFKKAKSALDPGGYSKYPKEMAAQALRAAYILQLACEGFELETGCPVSKFERLIHSAAPSIASSYNYEKCSVCLDNHLSHSFLCKHQIPNISLHDFWNWYEEPGNYGLEVKAEDSQQSNGLLFESTSFYFAPSLSAVQLFGYSRVSNFCARSIDPVNCELRDTYRARLNSSAPETLFVVHPAKGIEVKVEEPIISSKVSATNSELIFEFFESDQPHQRKPLHHQIKELVNSGTSNFEVFGDPSKLESLNLNDLHPASWFSVAWYPIYQIPEGKFRASFLTFHSLGHLVQKCVPTGYQDNKASSIVCPALGLQSYNAQGECWFDLSKPSESSSKDSSSFNISVILKEHLKTLEQNASLFARGCVYKNNVTKRNWQSDYEFFVSRKR